MNNIEVINKEMAMNHVELCELINKLRVEEGNKKKLAQRDFIKKIRKEVETLKTLGLEGVRNFSQSQFEDSQGKKHETFLMNRDGILQIASSESVYVRAKIIEYINALESKIQLQLTRKQELQLMLFSKDSLEVVNAHNELVQLEVQEATKPLIDKIEKDEPLVAFAEQVLKDGDNILVRELAKLASDHLNIKIGEKRLYKKLREWKYICINSTEPTQNGMNLEYFVVETRVINTPYGSKQTLTTYVTPKGQVKIVEKLRRDNEED